MITYNTQ